jgi:hypothetical protein
MMKLKHKGNRFDDALDVLHIHRVMYETFQTLPMIADWWTQGIDSQEEFSEADLMQNLVV